MADNYQYIPNPLAQLTDVPADSIVSRTLHKDPILNVTLFAFAAGQELTEHKTPMAATIHILEGKGRVTLGEDTLDVGLGDIICMPPNLPHSVQAHTTLKMLLTLAKGKAV